MNNVESMYVQFDEQQTKSMEILEALKEPTPRLNAIKFPRIPIRFALLKTLEGNYRVDIMAIHEEHPHDALVQFLDFGMIKWQPQNQLYELPPGIASTYARQIVQIRLKDLTSDDSAHEEVEVN